MLNLIGMEKTTLCIILNYTIIIINLHLIHFQLVCRAAHIPIFERIVLKLLRSETSKADRVQELKTNLMSL